MVGANEIYKAPADVWARIAAPLNQDDISWRQDGKPVTRDGRTIARFVAYVEANTVRERLDAVVPGEWDVTLTPLPNMAGEDRSLEYAFKARLQVLGVVREDVGQGRDYKQAATDAFKRAAVRFGIAHELYGYGQNWVELDGDGRFAKPVEDPAVAYARKQKGAPDPKPKSAPARGAATESAGRMESDSSAEENRAPARALDEESCPKCGGRMWDNRLTKRNPRAPDYKCRDRSCDGAIWPPKPQGGKKGQSREESPDNDYGSLPGEAWAPLPGAPMFPDDADLPF